MFNNMKQIKTRVFPESNYKAVWYNSKTLRIALDPNKPITELKYPEFADIKITDSCEGNCDLCYMNSTSKGKHATDIVKKTKDYFGKLTENQRPFQVALGGGEPTSHPEFLDVLKAFYDLGIQPNYTTNGMWSRTMSESERELLLNTTKQYCGGVALSCHPHLIQYWEAATELFLKYKIRLNYHIIISDKESIDYFKEIYDKYKGRIDYFVLLPLGKQGRATNNTKDIDWEYFIKMFHDNEKDIAFGANFYPYLCKNPGKFNVSLYEPEIMSKFIDYKDMSIYPSSFNLTKIN